jgi:hypothetical protein
VVYSHAPSRYSTVHLVFDIFQGIGIGAAVGIRPFLPSLAAGALAAGDIGVDHFDFNHTHYSFLQSSWFLLVVFVGTVLLVAVERSALASRLREAPLSYLVMLISLGLGGVFCAGSLCRGGDAVWPGWVGGVICAAIGIAASRPFLDRLRSRLDAAAAAVGMPLIAEGSAVAIAALSIVAPPVGPIALLFLIWLLFRGRRRDEQKYAGLRILR